MSRIANQHWNQSGLMFIVIALIASVTQDVTAQHELSNLRLQYLNDHRVIDFEHINDENSTLLKCEEALRDEREKAAQRGSLDTVTDIDTLLDKLSEGVRPSKDVVGYTAPAQRVWKTYGRKFVRLDQRLAEKLEYKKKAVSPRSRRSGTGVDKGGPDRGSPACAQRMGKDQHIHRDWSV